MSTESLYHVTIVSNLARAYDKYARTYSKSGIPESRFPDRFFLLRRDELSVGVAKARALLTKTGLAGDRLIVLETTANGDELHPNLHTGSGRYVARPWVRIDGLSFVTDNMTMIPVRVEEALAESMQVLASELRSFSELQPRSVSVLPIAIGCQASCPFCFSKASVSADQETQPLDWFRVQEVLDTARRHGATRAVITGGGEPGLLRLERLKRLIGVCAGVFSKVVLITNGYSLQRESRRECEATLAELAEAGLSVLSVSRHHWDDVRNAAIMNLDTRPQQFAATLPEGLRLRWVCVLQRKGVDSAEALAAYLDWAVSLGVTEFCFKELYVSTSHESVYHSYEANEWSYRHQVPLSIVLDCARAYGWEEVERLPWGAPVYRGRWQGQTVMVAAYTEPSLFWERTNGIARSWNLMADGRCLASLEDRNSEVCRNGLSAVPGVA